MDIGSQVYLRWLQVNENDLISSAADSIIEMPVWSIPETISFSDVVLLTDTNDLGRDIVSKLGMQGIKVAHTYDIDTDFQRKAKKKFCMGKEKVKGTTIHSFKGWEARYLVVCISHLRKNTDWATFYVALTRLKQTDFGSSYLTVICSDPKLAEYGASWPK